MKALHCTLILVSVVLAGCTVGPDYVRPQNAKIHLLDVGQNTYKNTIPAAASDHWWRLYQDTVLDSLIIQALQSNSDIRMAAANIRAAEAYQTIVNDRSTVQTSLSADIGYAKPSAEEHLQFGTPIPSDFLYGIGGALSYPLDLSGQITRAKEAAQADTQTFRAALDNVRIAIAAETTRAYLEICIGGYDIDLTKQAIAVQSELNADNKRLVAMGRSAETSRAPQNARMALEQAILPELQARRQAAGYRLSALLGLSPEQLPAATMACRTPPQLILSPPVQDARLILQRRPDIHMAEEQLHAATAEIGVATADLYPQISLGLSAGSVGLISHFANADTFKYSAGPFISWQMPNRTAARGRIAQSNAQADAALAHFDGVVLSALRDTQTALTTYARDIDRHQHLQIAEIAQYKILHDSEMQYKSGRIAHTDVLTAEHAHIAAQQVLAASRARLLADQVVIFQQLGGGW